MKCSSKVRGGGFYMFLFLFSALTWGKDPDQQQSDGPINHQLELLDPRRLPFLE